MTEQSHEETEAPAAHETLVNKVVHWFDARLGLQYELLRPAPK